MRLIEPNIKRLECMSMHDKIIMGTKNFEPLKKEYLEIQSDQPNGLAILVVSWTGNENDISIHKLHVDDFNPILKDYQTFLA